MSSEVGDAEEEIRRLEKTLQSVTRTEEYSNTRKNDFTEENLIRSRMSAASLGRGEIETTDSRRPQVPFSEASSISSTSFLADEEVPDLRRTFTDFESFGPHKQFSRYEGTNLERDNTAESKATIPLKGLQEDRLSLQDLELERRRKPAGSQSQARERDSGWFNGKLRSSAKDTAAGRSSVVGETFADSLASFHRRLQRPLEALSPVAEASASKEEGLASSKGTHSFSKSTGSHGGGDVGTLVYREALERETERLRQRNRRLESELQEMRRELEAVREMRERDNNSNTVRL